MSVTKREILNLISSIFDPLGILTPSTLETKLTISDLWSKSIDWDGSIHKDLVKLWKGWLDNLLKIKNIGIPHWLGFIKGEDCKIELIIFSDASKLAYGAIAYVKVSNNSKTKSIKCTFLLPQSRLAPLTL